jgi:cytosine/adenosine deaminase-related metal-dependent hydrolase
MSFKKFRADQLFDGCRLHDSRQTLITTEEGIVEAIVPAAEAGDDVQVVEGILSPGLINCHCHLELSHLKNVIPPHTGLIDFLCSVVTKRDFASDLIQQEMEKAEKEMYENGIVAIADIGNTADTVPVKNNSRIHWQNFVEVLSFTDEKAEENMAHYRKVADAFTKSEIKSQKSKSQISNRTSLVPHAPYSISPKTFRLINEATAGLVISIHNQENPAEDELYKTGGGGYLRLFKIFGVNKSPFPITGKSSLQSCLPYFTKEQTLFLVHNTSMAEEDIVFANQYAETNGLTLIYCLCPNANLYIEDKLPPVELFLKHQCRLVLGTDSYSSNWQLSIACEMQSIRRHFPELPLAIILQWATFNGARALQWDKWLGSFEKGKQPGITVLASDLSASRRLL